jgi:uncharacterized protein (TIGR03067 family)
MPQVLNIGHSSQKSGRSIVSSTGPGGNDYNTALAIILQEIVMRLTLFGILLGSFIAAGAQDDAAKKDVDKLQGTWEVSSLIYDGKAADKYRFNLTFKGDEATVAGNERVEKEYPKLKFKLDPATTPKCLDLGIVANGQVGINFEGIYELKDDELRLCVKVVGKDRPLEFASPDGSAIALLVLKRQ